MASDATVTWCPQLWSRRAIERRMLRSSSTISSRRPVGRRVDARQLQPERDPAIERWRPPRDDRHGVCTMERAIASPIPVPSDLVV